MQSPLRLCAIVAASVVALSFLLFAIDQSSEGSKHQVRAVDGDHAQPPSQIEIDRPSPSPEAEKFREAQHSSAREKIDDANDVLVSPFTGLIDTNSVWAQRLIPTALGLLLYGLGGLMLANFLPEHRTESKDWRKVPS
jgi:hypothetical protein